MTNPAAGGAAAGAAMPNMMGQPGFGPMVPNNFGQEF